jgi:hypothetical protein
VLDQNVADVVREPLAGALLARKRDEPAPDLRRDSDGYDGFRLDRFRFHHFGAKSTGCIRTCQEVFFRINRRGKSRKSAPPGTSGEMGIKLFTIGYMGQPPTTAPSKKPSPKVTIQVRVAPETRAQTEEWVRRYEKKISRPDVFRTLLEMGLKAAKEAGGLDLSPDDDGRQAATFRRRA